MIYFPEEPDRERYVEKLISWGRHAGKKLSWDVRDIRAVREEWDRANWEIYYCVISVVDEDDGEETFYRGMAKRTEQEAREEAAFLACSHVMGLPADEDDE